MTATDAGIAGRIRFVLVRTSHPGNIGAAARALRTMGLHRLVLVAPHSFPHAEASALAAGAVDVLDAAPVWPDVPAALGGCRLVFGATARRRGVALEELAPREAVQRALAAAAAGSEVAFVFGNERTGLENAEIAHCHAAIAIPSDPGYPSLNLAQAVQVIAYELRMAWLDAQASPEVDAEAGVLPAEAAELEEFFRHLARTLDMVDFHKGRSPDRVLQRLRRVFLRAQLRPRELRLLHGILADAERMARLATDPPAGEPPL